MFKFINQSIQNENTGRVFFSACHTHFVSNLGRFTMGFANWSPLALEMVEILALCYKTGDWMCSSVVCHLPKRCAKTAFSLPFRTLNPDSSTRSGRDWIWGILMPLSLYCILTRVLLDVSDAQGMAAAELNCWICSYCSMPGVVLIFSSETGRTNSIWCFSKCLQWTHLANIWGLANGDPSWL